MNTPIEELLASGEKARLIPNLAKSKYEERATSVLLAMFRAVPDFAKLMLADAGAPTGARAEIECYTEVVFKQREGKSKHRPDGLIVIRQNKSTWTAVVEAKVGNAQLDQNQCESYLDLAKKMGIDAVITISNQFTALPHHHPIAVSKVKTRKVGFYHFSWLGLMSKATLLASSDSFDDREQTFMMGELVRFLRHESSGVSGFSRMSDGWKSISDKVHQAAALRPRDPALAEAVSSWHQLVRFLAIDLTIALGKSVSVHMSRTHNKNPERRLSDTIEELLKRKCLTTELDIPNAASKLALTADFRRRSLIIEMNIPAPQDRSRATASINWLTRQIRDCDTSKLIVRACWPSRIPDTQATLGEALERPELLVPEGVKVIPHSIQVLQVLDIAGKFKTSSGLIDIARTELPKFYEAVGQKIRPWTPKPPKLRNSESINLPTPDTIVDKKSGNFDKERSEDKATSPFIPPTKPLDK